MKCEMNEYQVCWEKSQTVLTFSLFDYPPTWIFTCILLMCFELQCLPHWNRQHVPRVVFGVFGHTAGCDSTSFKAKMSCWKCRWPEMLRSNTVKSLLANAGGCGEVSVIRTCPSFLHWWHFLHSSIFCKKKNPPKQPLKNKSRAFY